MSCEEPDFWVLEYLTLTKDPRTGLVVAVGGTEQAADTLRGPASSTTPARAANTTVCPTA
ncbi:hypothetical protein [Streptomyces sp. NPDC059209]|uniref:hypothetical protein n=1 Tax=Streptomyces sp. NPDC059209 TaxID=3346769 RepID=UPI0036CFE480